MVSSSDNPAADILAAVIAPDSSHFNVQKTPIAAKANLKVKVELFILIEKFKLFSTDKLNKQVLLPVIHKIH